MEGDAPTDQVMHQLHATASDGRDVLIRRATDADEVELQRFFSSVTMDAALQLAVHRSPSLLDMYRIQTPDWESWIGLLDDEIVGLGSLLMGERYVDGVPRRIGYLGDLRLDPIVRGRSVLSAIYGQVLDDVARRHRVELFLTAVIASNTRAVRALTGPKARELGVPEYHLLRRFDIRAVHLLQPRRLPRIAGLDSRTAVAADIPEIAALLDADARRRPYGVPMPERELRRRLDTWNGLDIERFVLVERREDATTRLVGCLAPWDVNGYKQTMVEAYRGSMRRIRLGYNALATACLAPRLPPAGGRLRYTYATHHAVLDEDVEVQRLLLARAYRELRGSGNVLMSCFAPSDDSLNAAYRGYVTNDLPAHLYGVAPFGGALDPALQPGGGRPGFEMALV